VGVSTDSGDILGKILNTQLDNKIEITNLESQILNLKNIKEQKYPWFSGKTVNGKKLFEYFKEGKTYIERPSLDVEIKEINFIELTQINKEEIKKYILESIGKVKGDFRQEEILDDWHKFFQSAPEELQTFKIKLTVSSGTFIRAHCEEFDFPCCLLKLKRTRVIET
jgi:tRNA U55 pseudouridine synthase TruB